MIKARQNLIRVGFILNYRKERWLGGFNYLRNLIDSIMTATDRRLEPVLITGRKSIPEAVEEFRGIEIIPTSLMDRGTPAWMISTASRHLLKKDILFNRFLGNRKIDLLSHVTLSRLTANVPKIGWIADFQHLRMPEFFSSEQLAVKNRIFRELCMTSAGIILSSRDALNDLKAFCPGAIEKSHVLNFVPKPAEGYDRIPFRILNEKYGIKRPFFHLPNQFWAHKNHLLVIEALRLLKEKGDFVEVVATGNPADHRQSDHYRGLIEKVNTFGLSECFKTIGIVPYEDLAALMWHSVAVINPSLFEGWSTTVEEAKSMGKQVILSDIPVHREQDPKRGIYVDPRKPGELAGILAKARDEFDFETEMIFSEIARKELTERRKSFFKMYQEIVLKVL